MEAVFRQNAGQQDYTPGSAVLAGAVLQLGDGRAAVVKTDLAASEKGAVYTTGIFDILSGTAVTFSAGDSVYWDATADTAITAPGLGDFYLGTAVAAKVSGDLSVRTDLNASDSSSAERATFASTAYSLAYDDTAENTCIQVAQNPGGLIVESFRAVVVTAPAGSSEDQMVVTLYDSDDNALATLTTTDTTPDAAGDIIIGTLSTYGASTGAVALVIPADKGAYFKVTQATAGTPAGELNVSMVVSPLT